MINDSIDINLIQYLEGKLDDKKKKAFENNLLKSTKKLDMILDIKKDIFLMQNLNFKNVPEKLLNLSLKKDFKEKKDFGKIVVQIREKALELIENSFSLNPPKKELLAYRKSTHDCERLIFVENNLKLSLFQRPSENKLDLEIFFLHKKSISENVSIYRKIDDNIRLIASFVPENNRVFFKNISPAKYIIKIFNRKLHLTIN